MKQFREDDEYGSKWKHSLFSYFDEVLKIKKLRQHFGWNDDHYRFDNQEEIRRFYDWIIPDEEGVSTFTVAHDVRKLRDLISDENALDYLDDCNLQKAINYYEQENLNVNKTTLPECIERINAAVKAFKNIISEGLEKEMAKDFDLLIGLHAHGSNMKIIEAAAEYKKSFILMPCCVIDEPIVPQPNIII